MRTIRLPLKAGLLFMLLASSLRAAAPPASPTEGLETGWHIVRPGETMMGITARYLGTADLWKRVAQLNPDVADPNVLEPGQRIRIYLPSHAAGPAARVSQLSRRVEAQPSPIPWEDARLGDLLLERDGVRTYQKASAQMAFPDGTRLTVTEDSLVFLQRVSGNLRGVDRKSLEIVEGQADVESNPEARPDAGSAPARPAEVEIVLGNARATARTDAVGAVQTRARRAQQGGAALMAYGGDADLEAGGAKVRVPQGMGTSVAATGPPQPPEKLLPPPVAVSPAEGAQAACANPTFSWEPVPEAASYAVEVCRDAGCGTLVDRAVGVAVAEWRPQALPAAELFWRVTARSRSGLDGYPSAARRLVVTSAQADVQPPAGFLTLSGPQVRVGDTLFAGPGAKIEGSAADSESGPAGWLPLIDGRVADAAAVAGPWVAGVHEVSAVAVDRCGNRGAVPPVVFTVDATPPAITWDVVAYSAFEGRGKRAKRARSAPLTWSGGAQWLPLHDGEEIRIESDTPQAFFHIPGARVKADGREVLLGDGEMLRVRSTDDGSRVDHLRFQIRSDAGNRTVLAIETGDLVGNTRTAEWELKR